VTNLSYRSNIGVDSRAYAKFKRRRKKKVCRSESIEELGAYWVPYLE
jgi:hypothetical protein